MKAIEQKIYFYVIAVFSCIWASFFVFYEKTAMQIPYQRWIQILLFLMIFLFLTLFILEYRKLKTARLIVENQILHINAAQIDRESAETFSSFWGKGIEIYISCFGMLIHTKVVKFNQNGVFLKTVEIGRDYICLTYGSTRQMQKTRILHEEIGGVELKRIIGKFRYETGVVPVIKE